MTDLKALAQAATPGPWTTPGPDSPGQWMVYDYQWCIATATVYDHDEPLSNRPGATGPGYIEADANAAYIAAASPNVVLALLAIRDAAEVLTDCVIPDARYSPKWKAVDDALAAYALTEGATE
jgi:hypothetical protein